MVAGCLLGGYPVGRDWWGEKYDVGGMCSQGIFDRCFSNTNALPHINIDADVWGELNIMAGVYYHRCLSTLHI